MLRQKTGESLWEKFDKIVERKVSKIMKPEPLADNHKRPPALNR